MNFNYILLDHSIELTNNTILVIEETKAFSEFVQSLFMYKENKKITFFDQRQVKLESNEFQVIADLYGFDINQSSILKLVIQDLESELNGNPKLKSELDVQLVDLYNFVSEFLVNHELPLHIKEGDFKGTLKFMGLTIHSNADSIFERMIEFINVIKYLNKNKIIVMVNVISFFTELELNSIFEMIELNQLTFLWVEPRKVYNFSQWTIDNDYYVTKKIADF